MIRYCSLGIIFSILMAFPCYAEPDFYLFMDSCKITVGALHINNEEVKNMEGDPALFSCTRNSDIITCDVKLKGNQKSQKEMPVRYRVKMEISPLIIFTDEPHSDYIVANPSSHGVVVITRMLGENFAGAKVCQGMYMTASEKKALEENK